MTKEDIELVLQDIPRPWPDKTLNDLNNEVIKRRNKLKYGRKW